MKRVKVNFPFTLLPKENDAEFLDEDVCVCGHNIQEHEAVNECFCYVFGCDCDGFKSK